jgi:hypothetical protein
MILQVSKHFRVFQIYSPYEAIRRIFAKLFTYARLRLRALWWVHVGSKLPTEHEILNRTVGDWATLNDLAGHLSKKTLGLLISTEDKEKYVSLLQDKYPAHAQMILKNADDICLHQFHLLGAHINFKGLIDWHVDPLSGYRWPRDYIEILDRWMWSERNLGDNKIPWELNRHQYFFTLGKAYWLTGDERYADECAQQILSWISDNPPGIGINWYSSLEIGIRLISWAWAFHFFRSSPRFAAQAGGPFIKSFYQQADFLHKHLTLDKPVRNNHIIGEAAGLVVAASLFPEFKSAKDWLSVGLKIFEQEVIDQTFDDGVNKEQAASYHRFVLDFLILVVVMSRRGIIQVSTRLDKLLEKMLDYVMSIIVPDNSVPMLGDADGGRGYVFSDSIDFWDFRGWLAAGAVLYKRPDFKFVAQDFNEEAFWLLGPDGLKDFEQLESVAPGITSASFPQAGHYILRDDWGPDGDYVFFKCGPFGLGGNGHCAHSHCDLLSFTLAIHGSPVLIDSGTFAYNGPWRDQFRLTRAHNVVMVDGFEQANPLPFFGWQNVPQAECIEWDGNRVVGAMSTLSGVKHYREISHSNQGIWHVTDNFYGDGIHSIAWFYHFSKELSMQLDDMQESVVVEKQGMPYVMVSLPKGVHVEIQSNWCSRSYGHKEINPVLLANWAGETSSSGTSFQWKFVYIHGKR